MMIEVHAKMADRIHWWFSRSSPLSLVFVWPPCSPSRVLYIRFFCDAMIKILEKTTPGVETLRERVSRPSPTPQPKLKPQFLAASSF
jgi:hypothetical protein